MSATTLLDADVLIALTQTEHIHHRRATDWAATSGTVALCPITEGALTRFCVRTGATADTASRILSMLYETGRAEFWPDALSHARLDLSAIRGHRQVTDAYLAGLARHHGARLATLDEGLARAHPADAFLLPG